MSLPKNIPKDLSSLLEAMATDFPAILHGNLVGIYHHTGSLTRHHRALASKDEAYGWAMGTVPPVWRAVIHAAKENRLRNAGSTAPQLEEDAKQFVEFVSGEVNRILAIPQQLNHLK